MDRRWSVGFALLCALAGCGDDEGGSSSGGGSSNGGAGASGATGGDTSGGGGFGGFGGSCDEISTKLSEARTAARACDSALDVPQCTEGAPGICCSVVVNPANAAAIAAMAEGLEAFEAAGCDGGCMAVDCLPAGLPGTCEPSSSGDKCVGQ